MTGSRDRGGLTHVSNTTFVLLSSMEGVEKQHTSTELQDFNVISKGVLTKKILSSYEVHIYCLSVNWDERSDC